ncbi:hypothetical protein D9M69_409780 [compost metagenome]
MSDPAIEDWFADQVETDLVVDRRRIEDRLDLREDRLVVHQMVIEIHLDQGRVEIAVDEQAVDHRVIEDRLAQNLQFSFRARYAIAHQRLGLDTFSRGIHPFQLARGEGDDLLRVHPLHLAQGAGDALHLFEDVAPEDVALARLDQDRYPVAGGEAVLVRLMHLHVRMVMGNHVREAGLDVQPRQAECEEQGDQPDHQGDRNAMGNGPPGQAGGEALQLPHGRPPAVMTVRRPASIIASCWPTSRLPPATGSTRVK